MEDAKALATPPARKPLTDDELPTAGHIAKCPRCKAKGFRGRTDLQYTFSRGQTTFVYHNLRGAACDDCGYPAYLADDLAKIEAARHQTIRGDHHVRVTTVGRGLGSYWPADLVRVLGLTKGVNLFIEVLDDQTAILRVRH